MEHPLNESAWKRGWWDTKTAWKSLPFILLDAVGCVVVGAVFGWHWGLGLFLFAMLCVWIGATARAPIKQRNEARILLQTKPKPMPLNNRETLLKSIMDVQNSAMELINMQDILEDVDVNWMDKPPPAEWDNAYQKYKRSLQDLDKELVVAGESYELCILRFKDFVRNQVYLKVAKPSQIGGDEPLALGKYKFPAALGEKVKETIRSINEISGQVPRKEGSQN